MLPITFIKYIEEDKLIINTPITPLKFDLHQEPSIGTTCFFSKSKGYIGYEGKSYSLELKNHLKSFEKAPNPDNNNPKSNEILNKKAENTGYLRLESITEWLEENRPKTKKKRKIQSEFDEKEEELTKKGEEKLLEGIKPLGIKKKRKKNINRLLNKLKR